MAAAHRARQSVVPVYGTTAGAGRGRVIADVHGGSISTEPEEPAAATVAGVIDAGILVRADDVRYSLPLTDADDTSTY